MSDLLNHISEQALSDYDRLRDDCGLFDLGYWSLLELTGDDRKGWLQGQATNDLRRFDSGASTSFCICSPTGQIQCVADAWALTDRFAVTCQTAVAEGFLERVRQMVILEDVEIHDRSKAYRLLSIQGPTASKKIAEFVELPNLDAGETKIGDTPVFVFRSNRTGLGGWDLWIPSTRRKALETLRSQIPGIAAEVYEVARLEAGVPHCHSDYTSKTLAPEMGAAFMAKHVSLTKGCYTGQEVIMRVHSRGHTNRTWVGLVAEAPLESGAEVRHGGRNEVGLVTSAAFSPDYGHIGAAIVRNEAASDREAVKVQTKSGEVEAEVRSMPILKF